MSEYSIQTISPCTEQILFLLKGFCFFSALFSLPKLAEPPPSAYFPFSWWNSDVERWMFWYPESNTCIGHTSGKWENLLYLSSITLLLLLLCEMNYLERKVNEDCMSYNNTDTSLEQPQPVTITAYCSCQMCWNHFGSLFESFAHLSHCKLVLCILNLLNWLEWFDEEVKASSIQNIENIFFMELIEVD